MRSILSIFICLTLIACSGICLTGCYRMPTENDFSVVPTTNNPAVTRERNDSMLPGVGY
jgi:hypothetical protein